METEISKAQAFAERLRSNLDVINSMPDDNLRRQASDAILYSAEAETAADILRRGIGYAAGQLYARRAFQEARTLPSVVSPNNQAEKKTAPEVSCEPIEALVYALPKEFERATVEYTDNLFKNFVAFKATMRRQTRGLGPKKAARLKGKEEEYIERLFVLPTEGKPHNMHLVENPSLFMYVDRTLTDRGLDEARPQSERDLYMDLAGRLIKSGEDYVAKHADKLTESDHYVPELLSRYSEEILTDPATRGPAGHLIRGYFKTANTPERAVARLDRVLEAFIGSYDNRDLLRVVATGIFLWRADFLHSTPLFENLMAASVSLHQPELVTRARQLMQLPILYVGPNVGADYGETKAILSSLEKRKSSLIGKAGRIKAAEARVHMADFDIQLNNFNEDEGLLARAQLQEASDRETRLKLYLDLVNGKPGPAYRQLFSIPNELAHRYEAAIGYSYLEGDPMTDSIIIDDDYTVDLIWPKTVTSTHDKAKLRALFVDRLTPDSFTEAKAKVTMDLDITNHRTTRVSLTGFIDTSTEPIPVMVCLRKRTLYDNEHTSPLGDFDVNGFETDQNLPDLDMITDHITQQWTRVVPKRGIEPDAIDQLARDSGLSSLLIRRIDANRLMVSATVHGHERSFQIKHNQFFDKRGRPLDVRSTEASHRFAAYCLNVIDAWMCRPKIQTNEGVVEEGKEGPVKGGYFGYLQVRQSDGYKYRRQDKQWYLCAEERGVDLDLESERLRSKPESRGRNSTYYREHADDGPHLPPLKVSL